MQNSVDMLVIVGHNAYQALTGEDSGKLGSSSPARFDSNSVPPSLGDGCSNGCSCVKASDWLLSWLASSASLWASETTPSTCCSGGGLWSRDWASGSGLARDDSLGVSVGVLGGVFVSSLGGVLLASSDPGSSFSFPSTPGTGREKTCSENSN